jgi:UDP-N-acetylmuramyl pentapeptide phosphotransferase/UDP-N-acetylglucosamine-1-phosphate transferase
VFLNLGKYLIPSFLFAIFWIVLMINSMNWIDGVDGLSGGVSLIGALTIFLLSLKPEVNQPPVAIIAMALSGAILGFLIFNFYPSKILSGTSGSMLVMAIPIIDAVWVMAERIKSGNSIFKSDNRHLHHKLLDLGWSQKKIALFFFSVTVFIALIAVNTRAMGKIITMALVAIIMLSVLVFLNRKLAQMKK